MIVPRIGCPPVLPFRLELQPLPIHTGTDPFATGLTPAKTEFKPDPVASVNPFSRFKGAFDLYVKQLALLFSSARWSLQPFVISASRHVKYCCHLLHRKLRAVLFHKPVDIFGLCEKMAIAFFKMSRSSRRTAFSRRNRRFSASSGFKCPVPGKALTASVRSSSRQCRIAPWYKPRSFSICRSVLPELSAKRTVSRLNAASYFFRTYPI